MNEREQIINFLLQSADQKSRVIEDLQKKIAELEQYKAQHPETPVATSNA